MMADSDTADLLVPLTIGITGHRDLLDDEVPLIKEKVRAFFNQMRHDYPDLPLKLITPIAEGADQLAAEVALEMGISTTNLLPMPEEIYRQDFTGDALARYENLLACGDVIELPIVSDDHQNIDRDEQYSQLGIYLAAHSHILLAIWDGRENHLPGGTTAVIRFHQHETLDPLGDDQPLNPIDFAEDESDLVHHIVCSRRKGPPASPLQPGESYWLTRHDDNPRTLELPERYRIVLQRMEEFDADVLKQPIQEGWPLISDEQLDAASSGINQMAVLFNVADQLASLYQRRASRALRIGHVFVVLAGASFIIYADILSENLMIFSYLGFISLVLMVFMMESRFGWQRKYLDYRVLAEALRVQFYWTVAGVRMEEPHHFSHDSFQERRDLQLAWIRNMMRFAGLKTDALMADADAELVDVVIMNWIGDEESGQRQYYRMKSLERAARNRITRILEALSFLLVIVIALILVFWGGELSNANLLIAVVGLLPFLLAVRQNYAHRTAETELIGQFNYYSRIFNNAHRLITRAPTADSRRDILRALGKAALDESNQWVLRQRERPSGPVMGG
jgi:hypothetical protein